MEKKSKKTIIIGITCLLLVTLILIGLTYAYYRTRIVGNDADTSISVISKVLEVTYRDGTSVVNMEGLIEPGFTFTKTFSVENTGDDTVGYSIKLDEIENSFFRTEDWVYRIYNGTEISDSNLLASGEIPRYDAYIVNNINIATEEVDTYTLVIEYVYLDDVDQSIDMSSNLSLRVNIGEAQGVMFANAGENTLLKNIGEDNIIAVPLTESLLTTEPVWSEEKVLKIPSNYLDYFIAYVEEEPSYNANGGYYSFSNSYVSNFYSNVVETGELVGKYFVSPIKNKETINIDDILTEDEGQFAFGNYSKLYTIYQVTEVTETEIRYKSKVSKPLDSILTHAADDNGISYYFAGLAENNYVNYSGMCFRIVRVEGNGTIKLILEDSNNLCEFDRSSVMDYAPGAFITSTYIDNVSTTDLYANGKFENSNFVSAISNWLTEVSLDTSNLIETDWCNDTSIVSENGFGYDEGFNIIYDEKLAINGWTTYYKYGASERLQNKNYSLKCNFNGIYETTSSIYKGEIAALTMDEAMLSRMHFDSSYLNSDDLNWGENTGLASLTMSPSEIRLEKTDIEINYLFIYDINGASLFDNDGSSAFRPVIALKPNATVSAGIGTKNNPYVIS